jgi:hypothetical protein
MNATAEPFAWQTSLPQAQEQSGREGKPVLLDFNAAPE